MEEETFHSRTLETVKFTSQGITRVLSRSSTSQTRTGPEDRTMDPETMGRPVRVDNGRGWHVQQSPLGPRT